MSKTNSQVSGIYRRAVGDALLTVVNDGYLDVPLDILHGTSKKDMEDVLDQAFSPSIPRIPVNAFLVEICGKTILIDAGGGSTTVHSMGRLPSNLAAAGFNPEDIDLILLTHIHPDHSSGLLNSQGGAFFPQADVVLHRDEFSFWTDKNVLAGYIKAAVPYLKSAEDMLAAYKGQIRLADAGEVTKGIELLHLPGHTPGHSGYVISSGSEQVMVWGDTVHVSELQVPRPYVTSEFDINESQAAESRQRLFKHVTNEKILFTGGHLHLPGFAHLSRKQDNYFLVPEVWRVTV